MAEALEYIGPYTAALSNKPGLLEPSLQQVLERQAGKAWNDIKFTMEMGMPSPLAAAPFAMIGIKQVGKLPKYAKSVNLERQAISKGAKELELEAAKKFTKKYQSWAETERIAKSISQDYTSEEVSKILAKGKAGGGWSAAEVEVARQVNAAAATRLKQISENASLEEFNKLFDDYSKYIFEATSQGSGEVGRALAIHRKAVSGVELSKALGKLGRGLKPREFEEFKNLNLEDAAQVKNFLQRLGDPRLRDYFYEYWYNSILSGPPTHIVNIASNTAWGLFQLPHRALTAGVDKVYSMFTGKARTRFLNEVVPMMGGMKEGFKRGSKGAWETLKTGKLKEFETKWALEMGQAVGAFDRAPNRFVRGVGKAITTPTKALRAMDVWANSIAYDGQVRAIARRTANQKGLKGKARDAFEKKFLQNVPDKVHEEAMEFAKYSTFMDEPGRFGQWMLRGRETVPGGRLVIPFVRTIGNLLKRGVEMTPGVGLGLSRGQPVPETVAKQIEGAVVLWGVWGKIANGEVTGPAPEAKAEREAFYRQGKKAWSIKVGDNWYQYRRIEPYNTVMASAYSFYDKILNAEDEATATQMTMDAITSFKDNLIDSSYLQGVSQVLNRHGKLEGTVQRTAASFVPYSGFWRSINRAYEAYSGESAKVRDTSSWLGAFSQVIPGLHEKVPAKMNIWGEEIELPGGVFRQWLPYRWSKETDDPVEQEFEKLDFYPGLPKQDVTIYGRPVTLSDDLYRDYCISLGAAAKKRMEQAISSDYYKGIKDQEKKKKVLKSEFQKVRTSELNKAKRKHIEQEKAEPIYLGPL